MSKQLTEFNYGDIALSQAVLINDIPYMTRQAVGEWLEYENPIRSISKLLERNPHIESYSTVVKLTTVDDKNREVNVYQCRATLETLSNIKKPPVIFAKQANISNGHQQINNGVPTTQAENNQNQPNELLTEIPNETLDNGRKGEAISVNSSLETVG